MFITVRSSCFPTLLKCFSVNSQPVKYPSKCMCADFSAMAWSLSPCICVIINVCSCSLLKREREKLMRDKHHNTHTQKEQGANQGSRKEDEKTLTEALNSTNDPQWLFSMCLSKGTGSVCVCLWKRELTGSGALSCVCWESVGWLTGLSSPLSSSPQHPAHWNALSAGENLQVTQGHSTLLQEKSHCRSQCTEESSSWI